MQIEVKNLKSFIGQEGPCLQGTLYINGQARGMVSDDSNGGPMRFDDDKAFDEITSYAKGFPSEYDFMHAEILVSTIMQRTAEGKRLGKLFDGALAFIGEDGRPSLTKKIKGDVEATKARWIADPKTKVNLKVKRFLTDKNEFIELLLSENDQMQHPALAKTVTVHSAKKVVVDQPKPAEVVDVVVKGEKKFSAEKSKLEICREVFDAGKSRKDNIEKFVAVAGCTPAGAATYYQKLKTN